MVHASLADAVVAAVVLVVPLAPTVVLPTTVALLTLDRELTMEVVEPQVAVVMLELPMEAAETSELLVFPAQVAPVPMVNMTLQAAAAAAAISVAAAAAELVTAQVSAAVVAAVVPPTLGVSLQDQLPPV